MSLGSQQQVTRILGEVAKLPTAEQEAALRRLCGDDIDVCAQVRALLESSRSARAASSRNQLAITIDPMNAIDPGSQAGPDRRTPAEYYDEAPVEEKPGTNIGPYKLLNQLGEGGFGSVFMAEQERPVHRKVALKIIKLGMDTRSVVARFEQERQALAMMDHPNIAKVFDAGATSTGRPYFVMELCQGSPITSYCDERNLSVRDRLELFGQVCHAVQHAHSKGLIHRDIKPSNILVSHEDGRHAAKVIDFGIAKATGSKLTEKTLYTEQQQMIGTPQYMSPEQAEGSLDIDTRTDVYALGVVLYELLTGVTPFDPKTLRGAAFDQIPRMIREVDPPKPSTRLKQNSDTAVSVATQRASEPKKLTSIIRGELDWIVMKAVEKERHRRYETAAGLGMDVERYLNGDAVNAAPPSRTYQLRKFVNRNRGPAIAGALLSLVLVFGLIGTSYGLRQAVIARDGEKDAKLAAQREADRALKAEAETRARANELKLVSDFQAGMLAQIDPTKAGEELTADVTNRFTAALANADVPKDELPQRLKAFQAQWSSVNATDAARELIDRTILKPAIRTIDEKFKGQPIVDAQLRHTLAERYLDLGLYDSAQPLIERALETRRRELGERSPDTLASMNSMGILLQRQGKPADAERYYREALDKRRRVLGNEHPDTLQSIGWLGYLLDEQRRFAEAEPLLRETLDTSRRVLGEDHPTTLDGIAAMGTRLAKQGKLAEGEPYLREALEKRKRVLGEEHRDTVVSLSNLGDLLLAQRRFVEAEPYFREGLEKSRRVLGEEHPYTLSLANGLGKALQDQGKLAEAEPFIRDSLQKRRRVLGELHPETLVSISNMGTLLRDEGKLAEAEPYFSEALNKSRQIFGESNLETLKAINSLGILLRSRGRLADAEPYYRESLEKSRAVLGEEHPDTLKAINNMAALLWSQEKYDQAEPYAREAMEKRRRVLGEEHPDTLVSISNMGGLLRDEGKLAEAAVCYREAMEKSRRVLGQDHPNTLIFTTAMGGVLVAQDDFAEAEALLTPIEDKVRKVFRGGNAYRLAALLQSLGAARAGQAQAPDAFDAAEANLLEAHTIYEQVPGPSPKGAQLCLRSIIDFYEQRDQAQPRNGYDRKAAEWRAKLPGRHITTKPS